MSRLGTPPFGLSLAHLHSPLWLGLHYGRITLGTGIFYILTQFEKSHCGEPSHVLGVAHAWGEPEERQPEPDAPAEELATKHLPALSELTLPPDLRFWPCILAPLLGAALVPGEIKIPEFNE